MSATKTMTETALELLAALREAEAGLLFANADKKIRKGAFVPTPTLALRNVRAALAKVRNEPWAALAFVEVEDDSE